MKDDLEKKIYQYINILEEKSNNKKSFTDLQSISKKLCFFVTDSLREKIKEITDENECVSKLVFKPDEVCPSIEFNLLHLASNLETNLYFIPIYGFGFNQIKCYFSNELSDSSNFYFRIENLNIENIFDDSNFEIKYVQDNCEQIISYEDFLLLLINSYLKHCCNLTSNI